MFREVFFGAYLVPVLEATNFILVQRCMFLIYLPPRMRSGKMKVLFRDPLNSYKAGPKSQLEVGWNNSPLTPVNYHL